MFDQLTYLAWMAFAALFAIMLSSGVFIFLEAQRSKRMARILRAAGKLSASERLHQTNNLSGVKGIAAVLKQAIAKVGERFTVILGGEARETANDLASAGYAGRGAVLIYAFLKTIVPLLVAIIGLGIVATRSGTMVFRKA